MILIANSCVGGYLYKNELNQSFQTPFIWSLVDFNSMLYLIQNLNTINFNKIEMTDTGNIKDGTWSFSINIDSNVLVKYIHYKFSMDAKKPTVKGIDVFYNKIWEYIIEKYRTRVHRMICANTTPTFIFANWFDVPETKLTYERLSILNSLQRNNIICATDIIYPEFQHLKQVTREPNKRLYNTGLAKKIYMEILHSI